MFVATIFMFLRSESPGQISLSLNPGDSRENAINKFNLGNKQGGGQENLIRPKLLSSILSRDLLLESLKRKTFYPNFLKGGTWSVNVNVKYQPFQRFVKYIANKTCFWLVGQPISLYKFPLKLLVFKVLIISLTVDPRQNPKQQNRGGGGGGGLGSPLKHQWTFTFRYLCYNEKKTLTELFVNGQCTLTWC